ncbi:MAG: methyltransferase domain-containing protein [Acidimicrobiia bacterium]
MSEGPAARRWRDQLEAWAIPDRLLAAVEDSPYEWPAGLWRRRLHRAEVEGGETATTVVARHLLGDGGALLDVGAGTGRASLPLAVEGHLLTAVERDAGMAAALREEAASRRLAIRVLEGPWPDLASVAGSVDVALSAHVVYDVADLGPFLRAMEDVARRGVVVELTRSHPWSGLAPWFRELHGLDRPTGPTDGDFVAVASEVCEVTPAVERWKRPGGLWFESRDEIVGFYARRLVLPPERRPELEALIEPAVRELPDGRLVVGEDVRELTTVWWEKVASGPTSHALR